MLKIIYSIDALKDLGEINSYISYDNLLQAKKILENIFGSIDYLKEFLFLGKEIKNDYRQILSKNEYKIIYKIKEKDVYIVSIFKYKNTFEDLL